MHLLQFFFVFFFMRFGQCRDLWSQDLPEGPNVVLEKGKPIQLSKNYTKVQLCRLNGTLYSDSFSQLDAITELKICRHHLQKIEKGSLCASPSVKVLDIDFFDNNYISSLTKEMFENCNHLEELMLKFDDSLIFSQISLEENVFESLTNLKKFGIQNYKINHLTADSLKLPKINLKELMLSFNNIEQIDENVFDNFENLEVLYIVNNLGLHYLPKNLFQKLNKLERLILKDNGIKNLTWDEFEGLSSLKELNVVDNYISSFDADKIAKNLPNLEKLSIDLNPGLNDLNKNFENDLKMKINHSVQVSREPGIWAYLSQT